MSWLACLKIDTKTIYTEGISNDIYTWHKKLWECYPDAPKAKRDFLTRIDPLVGSIRFWVLAKRQPVCPAWCPPDCFDVKEIASSFLMHRYYYFDLRANPVKSIVQRGPNGETLLKKNSKRRPGKRVPIVKADELRSWISDKGIVRCLDEQTGLPVPGGFKIVEEKPLEISQMTENHFRKKNHTAYHGGVQFRGTLEVTNQEDFIKTYYHGIGSAKAFGFGLLLLAPTKI